ncbi:sulfite exporter TauE/SafE family protein [Candidatus Pelagibacter bacterium nBUS_25]|uniref:sulfite exporter TauE/SafE family protein n=1 Tax=Candidatus Pelagibacter bacterium nBUS_25 TaxID=3374187 RepID=UPI003EBA3EA8
MILLNYLNFSLFDLFVISLTILVASTIRGFNGFGFSATSVSGLAFILPAIEIVPIILILEVAISIFMIPYIWNRINWKFVFQILIGIAIGSPIGLYFLKIFSPSFTHLLICIIIIFFSIILMKGYTNKKIDNNFIKILTGTISGALNGLSTLGGLPVALFLLITSMQPIFIRGSLAALFFITDTYAFSLSYFGGIVDMTTLYRSIPLIIILPLGVFIGNKFFVKSREETYRKVVFYFLITISMIGILRILYNF